MDASRVRMTVRTRRPEPDANVSSDFACKVVLWRGRCRSKRDELRSYRGNHKCFRTQIRHHQVAGVFQMMPRHVILHLFAFGFQRTFSGSLPQSARPSRTTFCFFLGWLWQCSSRFTQKSFRHPSGTPNLPPKTICQTVDPPIPPTFPLLIPSPKVMRTPARLVHRPSNALVPTHSTPPASGSPRMGALKKQSRRFFLEMATGRDSPRGYVQVIFFHGEEQVALRRKIIAAAFCLANRNRFRQTTKPSMAIHCAEVKSFSVRKTPRAESRPRPRRLKYRSDRPPRIISPRKSNGHLGAHSHFPDDTAVDRVEAINHIPSSESKVETFPVANVGASRIGPSV